jgi:cation transport ATPase
MFESTPSVTPIINERALRRALITVALVSLAAGLVVTLTGHHPLARWIWAAGTLPVVVALAISIIRDFFCGRMGVDAIAFLSMAAALVLGQTLAGVVVAIMYAGGNVLEDYAVGRAERDLKLLVDRAPRVAHRRIEGTVEECRSSKFRSEMRFWCGLARLSLSMGTSPVQALHSMSPL